MEVSVRRVLLLALLGWAVAARAAPDYPNTPVRPVRERLHGTIVEDEYRWLEDTASPKVQSWVARQNALTDRALVNDVKRRARARIEQINRSDVFGLPVKRGGFYYYTHRGPDQQQPVVYRRPTAGGAPEVILDANTLSSNGEVGLLSMEVSPDGKHLIYGTIRGSDWETLRVRDTETKADLPEAIEWTKSFGWMQILSWAADSQHFYYVRYEAPKEKGGQPGEQQRIYVHKLGTPQSEDRLIFRHEHRADLELRPQVSSDGRYLVINAGESFSKSEIWHQPTGGGELKRLIGGFDANYWYVGNIGDIFYFQTDLDAPRWRLIAIDLNRPARENWKTVIPEQKAVLQKAQLINGRFVISMLDDVRTRLMVYRTDGAFDREIALPTYGIVADIYRAGISGTADDPELFFSFTSYLQPKTIYRYDFTREPQPFLKPKIAFDPAPFEIRQLFYSSRDGTRVPMFIVARRGLKPNGSGKVYLSAYGGFGVPSPPEFSPVAVHWLENGGIYAFANIRGGGEYGAPWHESGTRAGRQKSFDDFIGAAEYLIAEGYAASKHIAISGWSNGGLLTAAALTQRPDLFGAVAVTAPVTDMIRYTKFTIGPTMIPEFGDPAVAEDFAYLRAYSPYHRVRKGTVYPPIYVSVGKLDERTPAGPHSLKFTAALQAAQAGNSPIYLRVVPGAGHVVGQPAAVLNDWWAEEYAFLAAALAMTPPSISTRN